MKIEIFEKCVGGGVVETIDVADMKSFRVYWNSQCDRVAYGFRIKDRTSEGYIHWVLREPNEHGSRKPESLKLTPDLLAEIAAGNENLTPEQVRTSLMHGRTIHTSFSKYTLES